MKKRVHKHGVGWFVAVSILTVGLSMPLGYRYIDPGSSEPAYPESDQPLSPESSGTHNSSVGRVVARDDHASGAAWYTEQAAQEQPQRAPKRSIGAFRPVEREADEIFTVEEKTYPLRSYRMLATPNDPLANQWWVTNAGLPAVWDFEPGQYQTVLAVIDTGFGLSHEEFDGRWYQNHGETGSTTSEGPSRLNCSDRNLPLDYSCNLVDDDVDGVVDNEVGPAPYENPSALNCSDRGVALDKTCNQYDDDANGYVDDVRGWDVINQDNSVQAGQLSPAGSGTQHGTMVSGAAAATGDNGRGIEGVNWQTKILPIQALDDDGYGDTRSVGEAIRYSIKQRADVINISLGTLYHDDYVREAIEQATAAGITVVASSGNDGCDCVSYPARYGEVVAVGAIDATGAVASFSSVGTAVDVAAPGTNFTLPSWASTNGINRYVSGVAGTSFSSPMVAGMLALIKSDQPEARPLQLISALRQSLNKSAVSPHTKIHSLGYGVLDGAALRQRMNTPNHSLQSYAFTPVAVGGHLRPLPYEATGTYSVIDCHTGQVGLPVFELKNATTSFFSISEVETRRAALLGYSQSLFTYACLTQPHDTVDVVRSIDLYREFRNIIRKL